MSYALIVILVIIAMLVFSAINVLNEYERAVMFTLGRFTGNEPKSR